MNNLQLEAFIRASKRVYVWVQLSPTRGLYVKTTKAALLDYIVNEEQFDEEVNIEFGEENGELLLGRPNIDLL